MEEPIGIYYWTSRGIIWHLKGCIVWYCEVSREIGGEEGEGGYPCLGRGTGGGTYFGEGRVPTLARVYLLLNSPPHNPIDPLDPPPHHP